MSSWREVWTREVAGALEAYAVAVEQMAPGHWTFAPGPSTFRVAARLVGEWLVLDAPLPSDATRRFECEGGFALELLAANASLAPGVKLCAERGAPRLRAELPMGEDVPVGGWVQQLCGGIAVAAAWLATPKDRLTSWAPALDKDALADVDLEQLCGEAQWPFTARPPRTVMVPLEVRGTFQQAVVEVQPERGVVASVPVLPAVPATPECAAAAARFLLTATGAIRMVRAAVYAPVPVVSFEVVFARGPSAEQLAHACAALSVAWGAAAREAEVLARDAHIARRYLAEQRGFESVST